MKNHKFAYKGFDLTKLSTLESHWLWMACKHTKFPVEIKEAGSPILYYTVMGRSAGGCLGVRGKFLVLSLCRADRV